MYPDLKEDPDLDALLAAVGHMPYAVILIAKSGESCGFTVPKLLEEWNRVGTDMISHSGCPEENMNRSISLSVKRDFVQQNPDALLLLRTLALLPAGTSIENLRHWLQISIRCLLLSVHFLMLLFCCKVKDIP